MEKNGKSLILFALSIVSFSLNFIPNLTGNIIRSSFNNFNIFTILGFIFLIGSFVIFISKKTLDVIIIPTGGSFEEDAERTDRAIKEGKKLDDKGYYLISGYSQKELNPNERQVFQVYKRLRDEGIKPKEIGLEGKSRDTRENVVYSLRKIEERARKRGYKKPLRVGVVSYPGHLKRFEDFEKQVLREGLIEKGEFKFEKIKTDETPEEKEHEKNILRKIDHKYKLHTMGKYKRKRKSS